MSSRVAQGCLTCRGRASILNYVKITLKKVFALVAQGIEHRFPKPGVACSIHAGGTTGEQGIYKSIGLTIGGFSRFDSQTDNHRW